eukprot:scaffold20946_cov64-Phaeocystis_antarctica.AAC.7
MIRSNLPPWVSLRSSSRVCREVWSPSYVLMFGRVPTVWLRKRPRLMSAPTTCAFGPKKSEYVRSEWPSNTPTLRTLRFRGIPQKSFSAMPCDCNPRRQRAAMMACASAAGSLSRQDHRPQSGCCKPRHRTPRA